MLLSVNEEQRKHIRRNHTTTHLLQAALRRVLGDHVKQAGSLVTPERFRFDFTHFSSIENEDLRRIEQIVNRSIRTNTGVKTLEANLDEALDMGAIAFLKSDSAIGCALSGSGDQHGTLWWYHAEATGEIGICKLLGESSIASGIRRIKPLLGKLLSLYSTGRKPITTNDLTAQILSGRSDC